MSETTPTTADPDEAPDAEAQSLDRSEVTVRVTPDAASLIDRLENRLDLWETSVDAGLFLASIAVAHNEQPVPDDELDDERVELGELTDAARAGDEADPLTIFGVLDDAGRNVETVLEETLPGWIEAGVRLVEPRLKGANAVQAPAELADLIDEGG